jgi:hypothetical protein
MLLACLSMRALAFAQNVSFSIVSRSRNRSSIRYHLVAAIASNVCWYLTFRQLVLAEMNMVLLCLGGFTAADLPVLVLCACAGRGELPDGRLLRLGSPT